MSRWKAFAGAQGTQHDGGAHKGAHVSMFHGQKWRTNFQKYGRSLKYPE